MRKISSQFWESFKERQREREPHTDLLSSNPIHKAHYLLPAAARTPGSVWCFHWALRVASTSEWSGMKSWKQISDLMGLTELRGWEKETEVTSTALQELDRTKDKHRRVSISMGIKSALHSRSTDTQQSCSRIHQRAHKLLHMATWAWRKKSTLAPSPHAGKHMPSHLFRNTFLPKESSNGSGKFHRYGTIMTTRQKTIQLYFLFTCKATLI